MSLINKMLQDLDARGSHTGAALQPEIKPVIVEAASLPVRQVAIAAGGLVVAIAVSAVVWYKMSGPAPAAAVPVSAVPAPAAPAPASRSPVEVITAPAVPLTPAQARAAAAAASAAQVQMAGTPETAAAPSPARKSAVAAAPKPASRVAAPAPAADSAPNVAAPVVAAASGGREMTPMQRAESQYRQALAALDAGRVTEAMETLEQALKLNPRHDAARQSLAGLLIEAGRGDEAMQQLERGLALDAAQPSMAMLLARMQIDRGASGVATLQRTLPAAGGNADYHAFLAGALQREQRHREAAVQYAAALARTPDNGIWLMGLGISLQAEKRNSEALAAFQRAKSSKTLTPQLETFVDRKLQQLAP